MKKLPSYFHSCILLLILFPLFLAFFSAPHVFAQERSGDLAVLDVRAGTKLPVEINLFPAIIDECRISNIARTSFP